MIPAERAVAQLLVEANWDSDIEPIVRNAAAATASDLVRVARPHIEAEVRPLIEAEVRERIAAEIEAMDDDVWADEDASRSFELLAFRRGRRRSALIARGGASDGQ